jgi:hypothetical protein
MYVPLRCPHPVHLYGYSNLRRHGGFEQIRALGRGCTIGLMIEDGYDARLLLQVGEGKHAQGD